MNRIRWECEVIDGSVVNDSRQLISYSFVLDKLLDTKFFVNRKISLYKNKQIFFEDNKFLFR